VQRVGRREHDIGLTLADSAFFLAGLLTGVLRDVDASAEAEVIGEGRQGFLLIVDQCALGSDIERPTASLPLIPVLFPIVATAFVRALSDL